MRASTINNDSGSSARERERENCVGALIGEIGGDPATLSLIALLIVFDWVGSYGRGSRLIRLFFRRTARPIRLFRQVPGTAKRNEGGAEMKLRGAMRGYTVGAEVGNITYGKVSFRRGSGALGK